MPFLSSVCPFLLPVCAPPLIVSHIFVHYVSLMRRKAQVQEDLSFTRDQIITAEVNISRIYNWDVRNKRKKKDMEAAAAKK